MLQSKIVLKYKKISHGFFNRSGGYSTGIYKSLNCGLGSNDKKKNINANIDKVCKQFGCKRKNLVLLNQVHSNKSHSVLKVPKNKLIGDSLITNKKKIALGILTADCAPIFLFDKKKNIIAAIHAGWKGAFKQIVKLTVKKMLKKGSSIDNLIAIIGPCISKNNYEVKRDFLKKFIKKDRNNNQFFTLKKNRIYFSLNGYIKNQLINIGIKKVDIIKKDTFLNKNNFFSSRRSIKNKLDDYGRNISIIMIK